MTWEEQKFNKDLADALATFNRDRAKGLCTNLIQHLRQRDDAYPAKQAQTVLTNLRGKRHFDLMQSVADALIQNQQTDAKVRRQYAQSLIDQGNLTAAISTLNTLESDTAPNGDDPNPGENAEARGLLGRAYKDLYMFAERPDSSHAQRFLEQSIRYYLSVYEKEKNNVWHGINGVALIRRAISDGVTLKDFTDAENLADSMAQEILAEIENKHSEKHADTWDFATAVEACIGLKTHEEALEWLMRYLNSDYTDAFELGSTHRQFTQVWNLRSDQPPGDKILPPLKAALLKKQGCELEVDVKDAARESLENLTQDSGYEKILGTEAFKSLKWLQKCMRRASAVAKVEDSVGNAVGTTFVVRGGDFKPELGDELLLLTNAHVITEDQQVSRALHPKKALVDFELWQDSDESEFKVEQVWSSPPEDLDATLLRPTRPIENVKPVPVTDNRPLPDGQQRAYIIGHPQGRKLSFSIHDNYLLDYDDRLLHYRSPTEPGNSGSPVFNDEWELIGLHHRGLRNMPRLNNQEGTYPANEGIWIKAIKNRLKDVELG